MNSPAIVFGVPNAIFMWLTFVVGTVVESSDSYSSVPNMLSVPHMYICANDENADFYLIWIICWSMFIFNWNIPLDISHQMQAWI